VSNYLLWSAYPGLRPFIDGRQLHPDLYFKYADAMRNPEPNWPGLEADYNITIVLLDASLTPPFFLKYFSHHPGWELVFLKGGHIVFLKKGVFSLTAEAAWLQRRLQDQSVLPEQISVLESVFSLKPRELGRELLEPRPRYNAILEEFFTLYDADYQAAAFGRLIDAYKVSDDYEVRRNMAEVYAVIRQNPGIFPVAPAGESRPEVDNVR
jgi:hypothetical protein